MGISKSAHRQYNGLEAVYLLPHKPREVPMSQKPKHRHMDWAQFRFSVIGSLLARPADPGELRHEIAMLAAKEYRHPVTDQWVRFGASTLERWYYQARATDDPIAVLRRRIRSDAGLAKAPSPQLLEALQKQYARYPSWSYQLHADNLAALVGMCPELGPPVSYSTVLRTMKARGWTKKRALPRNPSAGQIRAYDRREKREIRSYEAMYVGQLTHLDFHEGHRGVVVPQGSWHTPHLLGILDDCSRICLHAQWYLAEDTEHLVHGHDQGLQKRGLSRELMTDMGAAMRSQEFQNGLARLGILWSPTLPASPYQNGKQENWFSQVQTRLMPMLKHVEPLTLAYLNLSTQAWVEMEYNGRFHSEIGMSPLERFLQGPSVFRPCPDPQALRVAFSVQEKRKQRRSDGTISIQSVRFEIPSRYRNFEYIVARWRHWDLSRAYMVDPRTTQVLCTLFPVDKVKNARGIRRTLQEPVCTLDEQIQTDDDPVPPLLKKLLAEYAATGMPPAYLPKDEPGGCHNNNEEEEDEP